MPAAEADGQPEFHVGDRTMKLYRIDRNGPVWARAGGDALEVYGDGVSLAAVLSGAEPTGDTVALADQTVGAPVEAPGKVICVGVNYLDHCRETNTEPPDHPLLFAKFPSTISATGDEVCWTTDLTTEVDYEAELVVVMGRRAREVEVADALETVAGYTCGNDLSARDIQFSDGQWIRGKNLDGFCALGPALVTTDDITDPQQLDIACRVNGHTMQSSSTGEMIYGVAEIISFCSHAFTLEPGDVIMTGTPHGVALGRTPSPWLRDGDVVEVEIEGIGTLTSRCVAR